MKADPIPNQHHKMKTCLSRLRLATTVTIHDVSDAFMEFRVSPALGSLFQIYCSYYQFTRMIYGNSIAPSCLEGGMAHVENALQSTVPLPLLPPMIGDDGHIDLYVDKLLGSTATEPDQCSFMDDILDFRHDHSDSDPLTDKYLQHDLPLKTQPISEASVDNPISVLGLELIDGGAFSRYPFKPIDTILSWNLAQALTHSDSLSLLGVLLQEPDFFDFRILPAKNLLVGLISKARAVLDHSWNTPIPSEVQVLILAWVAHLRDHLPQAIPRCIAVTDPLHLYVDASKKMVAYEARQFDRHVLRGQLTLTKSQRNLHINALELLGIYYTLARIRLLEFDTKMKFTDLRVYCDSLTAVAIARDR
ncbi:hypothetical protein Pmar_PMAR026922 [Perkinsus marinus ATCC 50983]|uniref:Reverse transcriptase RNase H-like domain-containing protein n=1 Tax=Perkinsus marinus (strain ATCC 50983 / TXsc) TaxID=423536 RepID=C5LP48_PERM5|nr:hypothetical protein Pmar_PMAR026922 [Perkinsus marinus ATCC 50983]EER01499.1 hypothetical protein Pmar_PMAR026922 [Perkinsus marinus ATCC 50983]|eukprot:XP_002768781.1 hypothetical protein Pmar_PMAR026922 [Perkinsus marinus ATCC 50983]